MGVRQVRGREQSWAALLLITGSLFSMGRGGGDLSMEVFKVSSFSQLIPASASVFIPGACVQKALKATRARSTSTTARTTTARTTPPAWTESITTHACAHQSTQVLLLFSHRRMGWNECPVCEFFCNSTHWILWKNMYVRLVLGGATAGRSSEL